MPLFELFQLTKAKLESSQERKPSRPEDDDIVELVWENGQLSMQNQSNKPRNIPPSNSLSSRTVQTHTPKEKDVTNGSDAKIDKFGTVDSVLNEIPLSEPSVEMGLSQDDDIVPWLDYPLDGSLQSGYGSDFLPEVSGVTENEHDIPNQTTFSSFDRRISGSQSVMASHRASVCNGSNSEQRTPLKIAADEAARPICDTSQASSSRSNRLQTCSPHLNSRISENVNSNMMFSAIHQAVCEESGQAPTSAGCFAGIKIQKQDPALLPNNRSFINFSHFLRPVASAKANLQNMGVKGNSGLLSPEKMGGKDNGTATSSSNPADSTFVEPGSGLEKETSSHCQPILAPFMVGLKEIETKAVDKDASSKNYQNFCWGIGESVARKGPEVERTAETVIACSPVCSGNSLEGASDDPARSLKRKHSDVQDSECHSEDVEEESVDAKKAAPRIGLSSKRSRSAEVHNLSERKRRDRINEKMRALQELIPNCNKVDKASMLDEAIEYLKTLQLQVQIMSMGAGYYMPPMMLPAGMQHMHAAHVAHFSPMGVGVGVGMGMGMGMGYGIGMPDMSGGSPQGPMVQMPPIHGTQFLGTPLSGPAALHRRAGSRMQPLGVSGQGLPVAMPHAPLVPVPGPGGSLVNSTMGENGCAIVDPTKNLDTLGDSSSKDPTKNIRTQAAQSSGSHMSMNQTSDQSQPQAMNDDDSEPPDEALEANRNGAFNK